MNIALIPARGGSKGLPRKNLKAVNGVSLVEWSVRAACEAESIDGIYVSTEDAEIAGVCEKLGVSVIDRPPCLASDQASSEAVIDHALTQLRKSGIDVSAVCLLQATSPLRNGRDIDAAFSVYLARQASFVISVFEPRICQSKAYVRKDDGSISGMLSPDAPYMRRQDLPKTYQPNGAIYIIDVCDYTGEFTFPKNNVFPYVMSEERSLDIDSLEDLETAQAYLLRGGKS